MPDDYLQDGSWYSAEQLNSFKFLNAEDKMDPRIKWGTSRQQAWIPWDLAQKLGLPYGGGWTAPCGELKKPNTQGVLEFLASCCKQRVLA